MARGLTAATKAKLSERSFRMASVVKLYFTPSGINMTDYGVAINNVNLVGIAETFTPSEFLLELKDVSETSSLQVGEVDFTLSAVDRTYLNYALSGNYMNVRVVFGRCVLNNSNEVIGAPWIMFDGRIKGFSMEDDGTESTVTFTVASHWSDFEKVNCRRTNKVSQQRYFPNDTGLNWSADAIKELRWGRKDF